MSERPKRSEIVSSFDDAREELEKFREIDSWYQLFDVAGVAETVEESDAWDVLSEEVIQGSHLDCFIRVTKGRKGGFLLETGNIRYANLFFFADNSAGCEHVGGQIGEYVHTNGKYFHDRFGNSETLGFMVLGSTKYLVERKFTKLQETGNFDIWTLGTSTEGLIKLI